MVARYLGVDIDTTLEFFDPEMTQALIDSINLLAPGTSVELTNGDKGLVITENKSNVLEPIVLSFADNNIIDLGQKMIYGDLGIKDIMKTMDNRYIMTDRFAEYQEAMKRGEVKAVHFPGK